MIYPSVESSMRHATVSGRLSEPFGWALGRLLAFVEGVAFWAAAAFPFVHVAAVGLYVRGSLSETTLAVLVVLHAAAIVAGHRHDVGGDRS